MNTKPLTKPLTKAEAAWMKKLENLMGSAPPRIGFFTIGDRSLSAYDRSREDEINRELDRRNVDYCQVIYDLDAGLGDVDCVMLIHSTAG